MLRLVQDYIDNDPDVICTEQVYDKHSRPSPSTSLPFEMATARALEKVLTDPEVRRRGVKSIHWVNIPDPATNPLRELGFYAVKLMPERPADDKEKEFNMDSYSRGYTAGFEDGIKKETSDE